MMDTVIMAAVVSFDATVEEAFKMQMTNARRWFTDFAAQYAVYWTLSDATTVLEASEAVSNEWSAFKARKADSCYRDLLDDIVAIRNAARRSEKKFDARAVWALYLDESPVLAHAAIALLSIAGCEACVERSFSAQGAVHSDRRNRLTDSIVEAEMFIRFNRPALRRAAGEVGKRENVEEMDDGYVEAEDAPSVAELFRKVPVAEQEGKQPPQQQQQQPEQPEQQEAGSELDVPVVLPEVSSVPRPAPSTDDVQRFIAEYVREHTITARFRWASHHEQQLQAAAVACQPPMRDVVTVLKKKIMNYVKAQAEQEAAAEDVVM